MQTLSALFCLLLIIFVHRTFGLSSFRHDYLKDGRKLYLLMVSLLSIITSDQDCTRRY